MCLSPSRAHGHEMIQSVKREVAVKSTVPKGYQVRYVRNPTTDEPRSSIDCCGGGDNEAVGVGNLTLDGCGMRRTRD